MTPLLCHERSGRRSRCIAWLLTVVVLEFVSDYNRGDGSLAYADTRVIPSVTVSERYDTNVFNAAPQFIPPGSKEWDLVTTAAPSLHVVVPDRDVKTDLTVGATGNTFVNNPELSFISTNAALTSNLDSWIGQLISGAKLHVSDYGQYTPQPPAFLTGVQLSQGVPDIYSRGLLIARANSISNTATMTGTYAWTPTVSLLGEISHAYFSLGQVFVTQTAGSTPISGLTTNTLSWSAGPRLRLSRGDTMTLRYFNSETQFSGGGVLEQKFATHVVHAEYERVTPHWTAMMSVGPGVIEPGGLFFYSGKLLLSGKYDPATTTTLSFSRQTAPSLFGTLGALISNSASVSVQHSFEKGATLTGTVNYALNESAPASDVRFETIAGQLVLAYPLSRIMAASLTYDYSHFKFDSSVGGVASGFLVDKSAVTLSAVFTWK